MADALTWSQGAAQLDSGYSTAVAWNYVSLGDLDSARPWHEQYKRDFPNGADGPSLSIEYFRASGAQQEAAKVSEELLGFSSDTFPLDYPLKVIRDYSIDTDRIEYAIDKYRSEPKINRATIDGAVDLILLLKLSGQNNAVDAVAGGYTTYHDPLRPDRNFENIKDDPEFKRLMGIMQDRVAAELAKVREMEQSGRLARTPEELDGIQFDLSL